MKSDERPNARAVEREMAFVVRQQFDAYREKYARYFKLERCDGILQMEMHTDGGSACYGLGLHNAWSQIWSDIGNDPDNEVLIFSGTGDHWIAPMPTNAPPPEELPKFGAAMPPDTFLDCAYAPDSKLLEAFIFNVDIPTIACINGPGMHTEAALLADITLCSAHAEISDPNFGWHFVPGNGQSLAFQELMGPKRAAYYMYTSGKMTAQMALEFGLVNEVLPRERLLPRAHEIANLIMKKPRHIRRLTSAIIRRQWKRRLVDDLGFHAAHLLLGVRMTQ